MQARVLSAGAGGYTISMPPLISCRQISKAFGAIPLFRDITLGIQENERLGLIGPNGSGKSTLLRLLAGEDTPDNGEISRRRNLKLVYLPQDDLLDPDATVEQTIAEGLQQEALEEYERAERIRVACEQVGFEEGTARTGTLSGGWKKRLALARALVQQPDLMLLDEPTNHLDLETVRWLERFLKKAPFAFLLISHDRYFLENVTNRIIELGPAYPDGYLSVEGTYSDFLAKKEEFLNAQQQRQATLETKARREIEWLRRGPQARTTKAQYRMDAAGKLMDELAEVKMRNAQPERAVEMEFAATGRKTKELLVAKDLTYRVGEKLLFSNLSFILSPGVRLGLVGPNGSGKTTLLRLLNGELKPERGTLRVAPNLNIAFFGQHREQLDPARSLRRTLAPNSETVPYRGGSVHVSGWAKRFLFRPEQLEQPVGGLSGGEQARVLLANLMSSPADLLLLDEPTNDLDIPTLEVLEDCLTEFPGAVVLVTHDRYMLDTISTDLLALDGKGNARSLSEYTQWERWQEEQEKASAKHIRTVAPSTAKPSARLTSQEVREWQQMEAKILQAEEEVAALQARLHEPDVASHAEKLQATWDALQAAQEEVNRLYARWEELENRRAQSQRC
jgi:ATP-binding cassette subfamily F protein uup